MKKNPNSHKIMGKEISNDLEKVDYFFSFLGTGGSSRGVGEILKTEKNTSLIGVVSEEDEYIPGGRSLNEMWETGFFDRSFYDSIQPCTISDAIEGMLTLQRECGLLIGPTGGATYQSLINFFKSKTLDTPTSVVFIACDRVEPYIDYIKKHKPEIFTEITSRESISNLSNEDLETYSIERELDMNNELLIDLRSSIAFKLNSVERSINMSFQQISELIEEENIFKNFKNIQFLCSNGKSSRKISAYMNKKYGTLYTYLKGGILNYNK